MNEITESALIQRINRRLSLEGEVLRTLRGDRWCSELGRYYIVDADTNSVVAQQCELEKLGRELDVLRAGEVLVS